MSDKRPLIFIKPYSETLQKLLEVCNEIKVQEGFEIYEIEDAAEYGQVVVSSGASLTLFSSPKKCALILQEQKRNIFKMKSKVMLLSIKNIDRKIHEKFTKMGLSELVVEPISPKTLVHKVKLLLRSLPKTIIEGDADNQTVKSIEDGENPNAVDNAAKADAGKYNKIDGFMTTKTKEKKVQLELSNDEEAKKTSFEESVNYAEEALAKKRKTYTEEELQDLEKNSKTNGVADKIDGYYRNKESTDFKLTDDTDQKKGKKEVDDEEELLEKNKNKHALALEDEPNERKKTRELDLQNDENELGLPSSFEKAKDHERRKKVDLLLEDDEEKNKGRNSADIEDDKTNNKKTSLDLLLSEDGPLKNDQHSQEKDLDNLNDKNKTNLELMEDTEDLEKLKKLQNESKKKKPSFELDIEESKDEDDLKKMPAEFIDKYYRRNSTEEKDENENKNDHDPNQAKLDEVQGEDEQNARNKQEEAKVDQLEDSPLDKTKVEIEVEEKAEALSNAQEQAEDQRNKNELEIGDEEIDKKASNLEDDEQKDTEYKSKLKVEAEAQLDEDETASKAEERPAEKSRKESMNLNIDNDNSKKKENHGKVDHIQTHYGTKNSEKKIDQNWNKLGDGDNVTSLADAKKRKEAQGRSFEFDIKKEEGFSFEKIEKEFSDVDPFFRNLKQRYDSFDYENNIAIDKSGNRVPLDEALAAIIAENSNLMGTNVENIESDEVFLVSPLGITGMIEASSYYHNKRKKGADLLKYLAQKILDDYGAVTSFIFYDLKNKTQKNWYCGHIELEIPNTNRVDRDKHWQKIFNEFQNQWKTTNEMTKTDQFLIFPLQEGITTLGLGIVELLVPVDDNKLLGIQNILSCALGLYYQEYHLSLLKKEEIKKVEELAALTNPGFLNKLFKFFKNKAS